MNRIDRLFGIMMLLQSKKHASVTRIAGQFEISERTVYRDIRALTELGIPLTFEPGKGYSVVQGYFLPPVSFTSEEAGALLLMETLAQGFADRSIRTHYTTALTKVKSVLKAAQRERIEKLSSQTKIQVPVSYDHNFAYLSILQEAISARRIVELEYKNSKDEFSRRRVELLGIIFYAFNWHVVGWCHLRQDYRDFRLSRIQRIVETGLPFTKSDHMDLDNYMKNLPVNY